MALPHALHVSPSRTQPLGKGLSRLFAPGFQLPCPPTSLSAQAGCSPSTPAAPVKQYNQRQPRGSEKGYQNLTTRVNSRPEGRFSQQQRPARPTRTSRPRLAPPPLVAAVTPHLSYLRCWGWPGGSGVQRTGEGTSRGGPCEVRSSSRPETQGCWGSRRRGPGAAGVPHPGAPSPASSPSSLRRCCPERLSPRLRPL